MHQVESIRAAGYCVTHAELDAGVSAVGAPVFGRGGQIFAAISVAGPEAGFTADRLPGLIDQVLTAAADTGHGLSSRAAEERL
jgi:DNA-binding IclR family transcriptional regulator